MQVNTKFQKTLLYISKQKNTKNKFAPFEFLLYLCRRFSKNEVKYTLYIL